MPLLAHGRGLALKSAGNGKLTLDWRGGNPRFDDSQTETILSLLFERAGWLFDRRKLRRSQLHAIASDEPGTAARVEQYAREALRPALDDGRIRAVEIECQRSEAGAYTLRVFSAAGDARRELAAVTLGI